jgi:hypothetical protein
MNVYIAEFRPYDLKTTPFFWKLVLDVLGTGFYHTGVLIGNRYFEMFEKGYREIPFTSFEQLNKDRGQAQKPPDAIDFVELPREFTKEELDKMIKWWTDKMKPGMFFGYIRFAELAFSKIFRKLSEWYYKKTGKVLIFARTDAEKTVRVCSSAVAECLKESIGYDLFPELDETIVVPGWFANKFGITWKEK